MKDWAGLPLVLRRYLSVCWLKPLLTFLEGRLRSRTVALQIISYLVPVLAYASCTHDGSVQIWLGDGLGTPQHFYTSRVLCLPRTVEAWEPFGRIRAIIRVASRLILVAAHGIVISLPLWVGCREDLWKKFFLAEGVSDIVGETQSLVICSQGGQLIRLTSLLDVIRCSTKLTRRNDGADRHSEHWHLAKACMFYSAGATAVRVRCWTEDLALIHVISISLPRREGLYRREDRGILQISAQRNGVLGDWLYVTLIDELQIWKVTPEGAPTLFGRLTTHLWTGRILSDPASEMLLVLGEEPSRSTTGISQYVLMDLDRPQATSHLHIVPVRYDGAFRLHQGQVVWAQRATSGSAELRFCTLGQAAAVHALACHQVVPMEGEPALVVDVCTIPLPAAWERTLLCERMGWALGED